MPKVAIIILNWNQYQLTIDTVKSIQKINHKNFDYQIIIVDNGSTDNSADILIKEFKSDDVIILKTNQNLGYVGGNNVGLSFAMGNDDFDYFLVANNDIVVKPNFLEILLTTAQTYPEAGIFGPKIYFAPGHEFHYDRYQDSERGKVIWSSGGTIDWHNINGSNIGVDAVDHGQFDQRFEPDFITGCCILIKREVIQKIGCFDDKYYLYLEDTDFCIRARRAGFHLLYVPESIIWHINAGSSKPGSQLHNYFLTRNRLIFASRFASLRTRAAIFRESLRILFFDPSLWRKKAVVDFYLHRLGRGSWQ